MITASQKTDDAEWLQELASRVLQLQPPISHDRKPEVSSETGIHFSMKPRELIDYVKAQVVKQDSAITTIATTICTHYNAIRYLQECGQDPMQDIETIKPNILLIGPTGVGKTYIVKRIAKKLGVPFLKADATKFSETGYVGGDVEDLVRDLLKEAGGDLNRAQYGIIFLDEIDKIASDNKWSGKDVSGSGVQRGLLKIIEETEVALHSKNDIMSQIDTMREYQQTGKVEHNKINTKNILFIFSGAFDQLNDIINVRMNRSAIGFSADVQSEQESEITLQMMTSQDLIDFGFETEFVGRVPIIAILDHLTQDDLLEILETPQNAILNKKKIDFAAYGIHLEFTSEALAYYAEQAFKQKTGARALASVVNQSLLEFEAAFADSGLTEFQVDRQIASLAEEPKHQGMFIKYLIQQVGVKAFVDWIYNKYQVHLRLTADAFKHVIVMAKRDNLSPYCFCRKSFEEVEQGFQLLREDLLEKEIELGEDAFSDPVEYMHNLITKDYRTSEK